MRGVSRNGLSTTRAYTIWSRMMARCYRPKNPNYSYYGGRGITVCLGWRESFELFVAVMGQPPSLDHSLDRIRTREGYYCGRCTDCLKRGRTLNCRWATKDVQARNQRSNRYYTYEGKTMILKDWAKASGIPYITLWNRLNSGIPFEKAITLKRYDRKGHKNAKS